MLNHRGQLTAFKRLSVNQIHNFRACGNFTPNNARIMIPICKHMHPKCDVSTTFSLSLWPPSLPTMSRRHFAIGRTPCLARKDSPSPPSRPQRDMICESRNVVNADIMLIGGVELTQSETEEVRIFQEYLRIPSVHPNIDYEPCVAFLRRQADAIELPMRVHNAGGNAAKPVVIITWEGSEPQLPSILLNSHMDVVPVFEEQWSRPPFGAEIDDKGRIIARGTQDTKCLGTQYLAAVRALRRDGVQRLRRTVHILFVPDEEIGGFDGMYKFVPSDDFKALNVGLALDEGMASENDVFTVFIGERTPWKIRFNCLGTAGHGSLFLENTASQQLLYCMNKMSDYRQDEWRRVQESNGALKTADVTTVNLTMLEGGVQSNVVPSRMSVVYDVRIACDVDFEVFEEMLNKWCAQAGDGTTMEILKDTYVAPTKTDASNPYWATFQGALVDDLKLKIDPQVYAAATDIRAVRELGIPAIGFSPINNTPLMLHDHDEYLSIDTYLRGIQIYKTLIARLANV